MLKAKRPLFIRFFMPLLFLWALMLLGSAYAPQALAHGVGYSQLNNEKTVVLEFQYATGDPAAYAQVKVYAPKAEPENEPDIEPMSKIEFQNGRSDALGRFSFVPNVAGQWSVVLTDGQGHRLDALIDVELAEAGAVPNLQAQNITNQNNFVIPYFSSLKAIFGLSIFLNIIIIYYLLRRKFEQNKLEQSGKVKAKHAY